MSGCQHVTSSVSPYIIAGGGASGLLLAQLRVSSAAILGTLSITTRWVQATVNKSTTDTLLLTSLGNNKLIGHVVEDPDEGTDITYEFGVSGLTGSFDCLAGIFWNYLQ